MIKKKDEENFFNLDNSFGIILSIILAVSISEMFKRFSDYETGSLMIWVILSLLLYLLSVLLIHYLVNHKSLNQTSFVFKIFILYLLVFFPYFLNKLTFFQTEIYILITGIFFGLWGIYEAKKSKTKFYKEPRFLVSITLVIFMALLLMGVL